MLACDLQQPERRARGLAAPHLPAHRGHGGDVEEGREHRLAEAEPGARRAISAAAIGGAGGGSFTVAVRKASFRRPVTPSRTPSMLLTSASASNLIGFFFMP